jgi:hypothetical protein
MPPKQMTLNISYFLVQKNCSSAADRQKIEHKLSLLSSYIHPIIMAFACMHDFYVTLHI